MTSIHRRAILGLGGAALLGALGPAARARAEEGRAVPPPALDLAGRMVLAGAAFGAFRACSSTPSA